MKSSRVALVIKYLPINAGEKGSFPGLEKSPDGGYCNPLQYSGLENPRDRGTWKAIVQRDAKSQTRLKQLSIHAHILYMEVKRVNPKSIHHKKEHVSCYLIFYHLRWWIFHLIYCDNHFLMCLSSTIYLQYSENRSEVAQ